jgi:hypothetical protein
MDEGLSLIDIIATHGMFADQGEQQIPIRLRSGQGSPLRCAPVGMTN